MPETEGPDGEAPEAEFLDEDPVDLDHTTEEALEVGRKLFARECTFFWGAVDVKALPPLDRPEVAFAGRSNVGKSSLLNALVGQNSLARSSQTPGRTRELNIFDLGGRLNLIDLPGYGYAKASKSKIAQWTDLTRKYLRGRATLGRLFLLIDSRHGLKPPDHELMEMLDRAAVTFVIVLTKVDKTTGKELEKITASVLADSAKYTARYPEIFATSSDSGHGIPLLRSYIAGLALPA